jgi:hypothetical protein
MGVYKKNLWFPFNLCWDLSSPLAPIAREGYPYRTGKLQSQKITGPEKSRD